MNTTRSHWKYLALSVFLLPLFIATVFINRSPADALVGGAFNPGNIIDDSIFYDPTTMTVVEIQNFLDDMLDNRGKPDGISGRCDTDGSEPSPFTPRNDPGWTGTRAQFAALSSTDLVHGPPYVCLNEYYENTTTKANNLRGRPIPDGAISAAQIIYNAAQSQNINPQVLLVKLQKEQILVTDDWPVEIQFRSAAGYGCPDGADCASRFFGFHNQVYNTAWQFNFERQTPHLAAGSHRAGINNSVRYHPNPGCGSSTVFIENQATASLYNFTPYQPNQAALNNLYGSGDACSSYGNRNFWRIFTDWFGSTIGASDYSWSVVSQKAFTDETMTEAISNHALGMQYDDRIYLHLVVRNTGNRVWGGGLRLATIKPNNRTSEFCDPSWISCNRPAEANEATISPGDNATFEFWIEAPAQKGVHNEYFNLLEEGRLWFPSVGLYYSIAVTPRPLYGVFISEKFYTNNAKTNQVTRDSLKNGTRYYVVYKVENIGTDSWERDSTNPLRIGKLNNEISPLCDSTWISCNRPADMTELTVSPGEIATFEFWITTPFVEFGTEFLEKYRLLQENLHWIDNPLMQTKYVINTPSTPWNILSQTSYIDETKITAAPTNNLSLHEKRFVSVTVRNLSGKSWRNNGLNPVRLATNSPINSPSIVCDDSWIACNRPAEMSESVVEPGGVATFEFWIRGSTQTNLNENYVLVSENNHWLGNAGLTFHYKVTE